MENTPFFSIIVPVYKVEQYIEQCVNSLLTQDYENYEIILVDDGSPDNCPSICDRYSNENSKVRVIHKQNGGLSDARNAGIKIAKGDYITFVDSDDFWLGTDVLRGVTKIIDRYSPDIIVSDFIKFYSDSDKYLFPTAIFDESINGNPKIEVLKYLYFVHSDLKISACQKFIKRKLLTFNSFTTGLLSEDIDWTLKIYPSAQSICGYDKPYYCYRQLREGSISNTASSRSFNSIISIINNWKASIPLLNIPNEERDIYLGYLAYQLSILLLIAQKLPNEEKSFAFMQIRENIDLFSFPMNKKTKLIKLLVDFFGIRLASYVSSNLYKIRVKLNKG